jgi:hypothetical protein
MSANASCAVPAGSAAMASGDTSPMAERRKWKLQANVKKRFMLFDFEALKP